MPRDLDSTLLRTFVTVVETGNISDAAVVLHRTQAAISMALRRLEEDVGQRLLQRSPRGVKPTAAGNVLLPYACTLLNAGLAARAALNTGEIAGTVRLGMLEDIAVGHLPHALKQFATSFENVALEIVIDGSATLGTALVKGQLDIVIGDPSLIHLSPDVTWRHPLRWAATNTGVVSFDDGPVPIVAFAGQCPWQDALFASLRDAGIEWKVVCTSASLSAIQSAVQAGLGIGVLLDWTIRRDTMRALNAGEFGLPVPPDASFGLYTRREDQTAATATLQQFLLESLAPGHAATTGD
ncbi:LysR family transcriptional regulator [Paraburkholderia unamae]|uniref:LysR family transcriptional regulator n=1 Tax=Paraburkholderia unamae TaxID=219649 RepID=A0ABX5KUQ7_9BURK|nr:LysR family transcriptional regulator [Paraburkholderia unamae]PVX86221.1 LysR family transcriptional regulator [Paraburkholderia unamae]RAR68230.1 LysR family transcriptional regulator [Paraburkholderia unamae]